MQARQAWSPGTPDPVVEPEKRLALRELSCPTTVNVAGFFSLFLPEDRGRGPQPELEQLTPDSRPVCTWTLGWLLGSSIIHPLGSEEVRGFGFISQISTNISSRRAYLHVFLDRCSLLQRSHFLDNLIVNTNSNKMGLG